MEIKMTDENKTIKQQLTGEADAIWNEIKDKEIMMFSLPGQKISNYCAPWPIEPTRLFLLFTAGAVLPAVELAVGPNYTCETVNKYIVISRK